MHWNIDFSDAICCWIFSTVKGLQWLQCPRQCGRGRGGGRGEGGGGGGGGGGQIRRVQTSFRLRARDKLRDEVHRKEGHDVRQDGR